MRAVLKKRLTYVAFGLLFLLALFIAFNFSLIRYALIQAEGQLALINKARSVNEFLNDPNCPDSLKKQLALINAAKDFAEKELGIDHSDNYTKLYDQQGRSLMYVVTACSPFELHSYRWNFPIAGTFSYKGFFRKNMAYAEYYRLKDLGYDVRVGGAGAWSTLGFLSDPILSKMLTYSDGALVETIIHELSHTAVYLRDSVEFNENLAQFIGRKGALQFLKKDSLKNAEAIAEYEQELADEKEYNNFMLLAGKYIDSIYAAIQNRSVYDKVFAKRMAYIKIMKATDTLSFYDKSGYRRLFRRMKTNNTYFADYRRYEEKQEYLEELFLQKKGQLRAFLDVFRNK